MILDKIDISGKVITADAMSMQKDIIDRIRSKGGDFLIEPRPTSAHCDMAWKTASKRLRRCIHTP